MSNWDLTTMWLCLGILAGMFGGGYISFKWDDIKEYFEQCIF